MMETTAEGQRYRRLRQWTVPQGAKKKQDAACQSPMFQNVLGIDYQYI